MREICENNPWYTCCENSSVCSIDPNGHHHHDTAVRHNAEDDAQWHGGRCGCGNGASVNGRKASIRLRRPDVMYKVYNAAAIVKDSIPDEDKTHEMRAWVEDLTADNNVDRVTDLLDLAFADVLMWLDERMDDGLDGDVDVDSDDYIIMPKTPVSKMKAKYVLRPKVAEYMVAYVLWQWLLHKGFTVQAAPWELRMKQLKEEIRDGLVGGHMKRPMTVI